MILESLQVDEKQISLGASKFESIVSKVISVDHLALSSHSVIFINSVLHTTTNSPKKKIDFATTIETIF